MITVEDYLNLQDELKKKDMLLKWTPVSEGLPEKDGAYLVTQKFTGITNYTICSGVSIVYYSRNLSAVAREFADVYRAGWYNSDDEYGYWEVDNVVAWMPLPEPYKEG